VRIAVLTSSYPRYPGDGTAPFVKDICEHLAKLGHPVEVVAPHDPAVIAQPQAALPIQVHRFRYIWPENLHIMGHARSMDNDMRLRPLAYLLLPFFLFSAFLKLMQVTRRQNSQVIHAHWVLPNGLVAAWVAALRGIPLVLSLHGSDMFIAQRNALFRTLARWVFRRAAGVTTCSPELRNAALGLGAPGNSLLLVYGVDPAEHRPELRHPSKRRALQHREEEILIAGLGRFVSKKGFGCLIAAMPQVVQECPQAHLILGGDGVLRKELEDLAKRLGVSGHITFKGNIPLDEVPGFLANVDIFVLPSVRDPKGNVDGLPTALLEAMSSAAAVVASDIGGVSLVVEPGVNGLLVPPGDAHALATTILDLVRDESRRLALGQAARNSILEQFNLDNAAARMIAYMESISTSYPGSSR